MRKEKQDSQRRMDSLTGSMGNTPFTAISEVVDFRKVWRLKAV
jgi:hypothetical protein